MMVLVDEYEDAPMGVDAYGTEDAEMELGVGGGRVVSTRSLARSSLLPTRRRERFGEARARASLRKGWRLVKVLCEVMS
jgi:hypothetical protein